MKWCAILPLLLASPVLATAQTILLFDGRQSTGAITAITDSRIVAGDQNFERKDVHTVTFTKDEPADMMTRSGQHVVMAGDGSRLAVTEELVTDGKLIATTACAGKVVVPLEGITRLLRPGADETPSTLDAIKPKRSAQDAILVGRHSTRAESVTGILLGLDPQRVRFRYEDTETEMPATTVLVVELASLQDKPMPAVMGRVLCADGSLVAFSQLALDGGKMTVTSPSLGVLRLDRAGVARITFAPDNRLTYLDTLKPVAVKQTSFFREEFRWQNGKSVMGQPLRVGGAAYEHGLGLHARTELAYELAGQYRLFTAIAGIDESVMAGLADLTILLDGKPLLAKQRLDRSQPPASLRLDVQGGQRLTILVDFVAGGYGSGSRVNLCEAALTK
jgi:hypothetical protein